MNSRILAKGSFSPLKSARRRATVTISAPLASNAPRINSGDANFPVPNIKREENSRSAIVKGKTATGPTYAPNQKTSRMSWISLAQNFPLPHPCLANERERAITTGPAHRGAADYLADAGGFGATGAYLVGSGVHRQPIAAGRDYARHYGGYASHGEDRPAAVAVRHHCRR